MEKEESILEKFGIDLTDLAFKNAIDPVIGRDEEIRRTLQILVRRTKNNPVLVGDPGVGKTAIVEGLAHRITKNDVPISLANKKLYSIQISSLLAGAKFRGEFEERLTKLLDEVSAQGSDIILFIDELHTIMGAGGGEGAVDASNILKPMLARGKIRLIGATTTEEYRKFITKDMALERRFQLVEVNEPSKSDSLTILRGIKEKYEQHHGVSISDEALIAAINLSSRYILDRFLPDKAIDLIDEATSKIKLDIETKPKELDSLERRIAQLSIEQKQLDKEKQSSNTLDSISKEIEHLRNSAKNLNERWLIEKNLISEISVIQSKIESEKFSEEIATKQGDFEKASKIKYETLPKLHQELTNKEADLAKIDQGSRLLKEKVDENDIGEVVSTWTNIPLSKLMQSERERILRLEQDLEKLIIGQKDAVVSVSRAMRRQRAGFSNINKPLGSFLFVGPTGVGKTELTKSLANLLFDDEKNVIRIDMSEYSQSHTISRLIGSPPGYVGYEEGGQLTKAIKKRPYSVVLFDEVEKAHPEIFNIFLQILDEGMLTDSMGKKFNFTNALIIFTSNIGSDKILDEELTPGEIQNAVKVEVSKHFKPELLNRLSDVIIFNRLSQSDVLKITTLELEKIKLSFRDHQIELDFTDEVVNYIADNGFDPLFGARPLKRLIESEIIDELALLELNESLKNKKVLISKKSNKLEFKVIEIKDL